ncbi:MAG TPA: hypothetical protein VGN42_25720, partial [Pirellulales bacterium]|nr:hypothetical protein [Pirellulales bacterium]
MRTRRRLILFFLSLAVVATVALALAGFLYWPRRVVLAMPENKDFRQEGEPAAQLVQMFGGAAGLETIRHPDRVEGFRIFDDPHDRETSFPVTAGPILVAKSDADLISAALLSPDSYGWKYLKGCDPDYGVCLSFFRGSDRVDVALCFFCGVLLVG